MSSSSKKADTAKQTPKTVGALLKATRTEKKLSLKEVELTTRIRGKYLLAIEADDYGLLPHDTYTKGFIQSYAEYLGLDGSKLVDRYLKERGDAPVELTRKTSAINTGSTVSPRTITLAGVGITIAVIVGYLFWQFSALTAPPKLEVAEPNQDQVLYGSLLTVKGQVDGGSDVFINDSPILSDGEGRFENPIALQDGVNVIRVSAKNRLGKSTTVTRNVLARVPQNDASNALPAVPFDGIAVSIQIKDATTSVTVQADGKEVFRGTMLPGTIQNFRAANKLTISTTNAGATQLMLTNATGANISLGATGQLGQTKNNLEFTKDTQFQQ